MYIRKDRRNMEKDNNTYSVYQHVFPNGMIYTGLTHLVPPEKRFGKDGYRYKGNKKLYSQIELYGWNNIEHIIVESSLSQHEAQKLEQELIASNKEKGISYNISSGGDIGGESYLLFEYKGERLSLLDIYKKYHNLNNGVTIGHFYTRVLRHKWDIDRALIQPTNEKEQPFGVGERIYNYEGEMLNSYELWQKRKIDDITQQVIVLRINRHGWDIERALSTPMKRYNQLYEYKGNMYTTDELAHLIPENKLENHDITDRLRAGWTVEEAVERSKVVKKKYMYDGKERSLSEIYRLIPEENKIGYSTFAAKIKKGMSFEEAIKK